MKRNRQALTTCLFILTACSETEGVQFPVGGRTVKPAIGDHRRAIRSQFGCITPEYLTTASTHRIELAIESGKVDHSIGYSGRALDAAADQRFMENASRTGVDRVEVLIVRADVERPTGDSRSRDIATTYWPKRS